MARTGGSGHSVFTRIPLWVWLALALASWLLSRLLIGLAAGANANPAQALSSSLWRAAGYSLSFAGPAIFILLAIGSALVRLRARAPGEPQRVEPDLVRANAPALDMTRWSLELLNALEWKRLEQLGAEYFRRLGFQVEEATHGPDGGVDLRLYVEGQARAGVLVQCKAWNTWKVGVKEIRELFGVMAAEHVSEGIFMTTSAFTDEAIAFAHGKNIFLIDGRNLLGKLQDLPASDQARILQTVTEGDFRTPTCPSCGIKMVKRLARGSGEPFWGCLRFPRCRSRIDIARS